MEQWERQGHRLSLAQLVEAAEGVGSPDLLLDVDHPELMLPGDMPKRINARRKEAGLAPIPEDAGGAPTLASLIFHSLAARYAQVLRELAEVTGRQFRTLHVVGGGARNRLLNRLTAEASGLKVQTGHVESSTIGNLAIQMAVFECQGSNLARASAASLGPSHEEISACAQALEAASYE
jgi:rhamnulokinase